MAFETKVQPGWDEHPRTITDEQFADGTTIDGDRLDRAMGDVVARFNEVRLGDLKRRWVQQQYVMGHSPQDEGSMAGVGVEDDHRWPFLQDQSLIGEEQSFFHTKGSEAPDSATLISQWVWSTGLYFVRPAVVTHVALMMEVTVPGGAPYPNTFLYGATPPAGFGNGQRSQDVTVQLATDYPFSTEQVELASLNFNLNRLNLGNVTNPAGSVAPNAFSGRLPTAFTDMAPTGYPGGALAATVIMRSVKIPIHQRSRVRVKVVIPRYSDATTGTFAQRPWYKQAFHLVLTTQEELQ